MGSAKLLSAKETANLFRVPVHALYRMAKDGRITAHEMPKKPWHKKAVFGFDPADVARALGLDPPPD